MCNYSRTYVRSAGRSRGFAYDLPAWRIYGRDDWLAGKRAPTHTDSGGAGANCVVRPGALCCGYALRHVCPFLCVVGRVDCCMRFDVKALNCCETNVQKYPSSSLEHTRWVRAQEKKDRLTSRTPAGRPNRYDVFIIKHKCPDCALFMRCQRTRTHAHERTHAHSVRAHTQPARVVVMYTRQHICIHTG